MKKTISNPTAAIKVEKDNYEFLVECACRYCLGRLSYAPWTMCQLLKFSIPNLSPRSLFVLHRDITDHLSQAQYSSAFSDIPQNWEEVAVAIKKELDARGPIDY